MSCDVGHCITLVALNCQVCGVFLAGNDAARAVSVWAPSMHFRLLVTNDV